MAAVRFQVLTVAINLAGFRVVARCSLVKVGRLLPHYIARHSKRRSRPNMATLRSSERAGATLTTLTAHYSWVLKLCGGPNRAAVNTRLSLRQILYMHMYTNLSV
jgi:hypothetical protein